MGARKRIGGRLKNPEESFIEEERKSRRRATY